MEDIRDILGIDSGVGMIVNVITVHASALINKVWSVNLTKHTYTSSGLKCKQLFTF